MSFRRSVIIVSAGAIAAVALAISTATPTSIATRPYAFLPGEVAQEPGMTPPRFVAWDLPVARNDRVDHFIRFLTGRNRDKTALWLERSGRYGPMTREKLRARGMPEDLTYLALIESGFSPMATSTAKAIGLWQFIEETGRRYGLRVTPYLDERRDPVKATDAALTYLQELYVRFGSWYLAAAAYNTGENRVERILRERAGNARGEEELYWLISPFLPRETRDYVPLMLAAGHIGKEPARYGFDDLDYHPLLEFDTVRAPGGVSLELIARAAGVDAQDVVDLNPHYVQKVTPPGALADVRIPHGRLPIFELNFPRVAAEVTVVERVRAASARIRGVRTAAVRSAAAKIGAVRPVRVRVAAAPQVKREVAAAADRELPVRDAAPSASSDDAPKRSRESLGRKSRGCELLRLPSSPGRLRSRPGACPAE